jgi:xanthine dehydrogenase accessory factor
MLLMEKVALLARQNETFALAMITESRGSTPRNVGKMIVYRDGQIEGTIGGGLAEYYVIRESVQAIQKGQSKLVEYKLNKEAKDGISMNCGGTLRVFIEVYKSRPELFILGAGHVGFALSKLAEFLEFPYSIIDDRPTYCTRQRFPNATKLFVHENIEKAIIEAGLNEKSYVIIVTKDGDDIALKTALTYPITYIGMIASKRKVIRIFEKLRSEGVSQEKLDTVHTPIGIEIGAETAEEIAISIIAEIIELSRTRCLKKNDPLGKKKNPLPLEKY